ncbi:peptidase M24 [Salpingoeca rosetta]|uniref:Peptidase M24 n=1 Tax=Salpingoeca rosetta (strain ATCC 50818 / BSB-021) TaxID=946362 RepID=F2UQP7_SALR5|nr:peptidase M24 [Salpingoeca rosetta]EGD79952.1 peptidase M24 [Salpingoeca rosetta]|eukprot:XP_004988573.1 peptidase M24 [Salpingoeca rosetta]
MPDQERVPLVAPATHSYNDDDDDGDGDKGACCSMCTRRRLLLGWFVMCVALVAATVVAVQQGRHASAVEERTAFYACGVVDEALDPVHVPQELYPEVKARVEDVLPQWFNGTEALLFLQGGDVQLHFFADTERTFWQESNFRYLSGGYERPGGAWLLCSAALNDTVPWHPPPSQLRQHSLTCHLFVDKPTLADAIWNGKALTLEQLRAMYTIDHIHWKDDFATVVSPVLAALNVSEVDTMPASPQLADALPAPLDTLTRNRTRLRDVLGEARGVKTPTELRLMRAAAAVGSAAHNYILRSARKSEAEYQVEAAFVAVNTACGLQQQSYLPIVASGPRAGTLHYNTNMQPLEADWLLVDAGATVHGYGTDITRTWALSGHFSSLQRQAYEVVLGAQLAGIAAYRAGNTWVNATREAEHALLRGLLETQLVVNATFDALAETNITRVFMPHSLGHHIGLDVHDYVPGGLGRCRPSEDPLEPIECPGTLEVGMVVTCEPGLYFIPQLLQESYATPSLAPFLNKAAIDAFISAGVGGVRIEDVVVITQDAPDVISSGIPKTIKQIQHHVLS